MQSTERCPVRSCMRFSGTFASNKAVAAVARSEWFVFFSDNPASVHVTFTMVANLFLPVGVVQVDAFSCVFASQR